MCEKALIMFEIGFELALFFHRLKQLVFSINTFIINTCVEFNPSKIGFVFSNHLLTTKSTKIHEEIAITEGKSR
jgi:hypothetical protein